MHIYRHFYVESRTSGGWVVPQGFEPEDWTFKHDRAFGGFAWAHPSLGWLDLFRGNNSLFPMRPEPPDNRGGSPLLRHLETHYGFERNEAEICWIRYQELITECWDNDSI